MHTYQHILHRLVFHLLCVASVLMTLATTYLYRDSIVAYALDWYSRLGWVIVPLLALTVLLFLTIFRIATNSNPKETGKNLLHLAIVTYAAPTVGFMGTIVGLQSGLTGFDSDTSPQELNDAVNGVVSGLTVSLSSTLVGGILGLLSGLSSMLYRHALEIAKANESPFETSALLAEKAPTTHLNDSPAIALQFNELMKTIGDDITSIRPAQRQGKNVAYTVTVKDASVIDSIIERIKHHKQQLGLQHLAIKRHKSQDKVLYLIPTTT